MIKRNFYPISLGLVFLSIIITNYVPQTWLIGWDNLLPELNILANIKRSIFAVWQQYQGLGLIGGMGHASDLVRQLIILPFTLFLPHSIVRYFWHFSMIGLGSFGVYFFSNKHLKNKPLVSFLAALFYIFNLGTIQYFWAPYEAFSTFFGFFPWLFLALFDHLHQPNRKTASKLLILNLLATPSFYVPTLFIVYLICVLIVLFVIHKSYIISLKSLFYIIIINTFWLLPFVYFFFTSSQNPQLSLGNNLASQETLSRNLNHSNIIDFLLLKNYYFDIPTSDGQPFMTIWIKHLQAPIILISGVFISSFVIVGLLTAAPPWLIALFILISTALLSTLPPFSWLNEAIRISPLINQVFRAPFTKIIVPTTFVFSLLFSVGFQKVNSLLPKQKIAPIIILLAITLFIFPVFQGNYISPTFKKQIAPEYFQLFDYFSKIPESARIANLPSGSLWGWTDYNNGITGSGFLWYGLSQPVLDRTFDVWNINEEQYYWELDHALQRRDNTLLNQVLSKYNVNYLIFDNNVIFPNQKVYSKQSLATSLMLQQNNQLILDKVLGNISIYKYSNSSSSPYLISNPVTIKPFSHTLNDTAFLNHSDYIISPNPSVDFPYIDLFTSRLQSENNFQINADSNSLIFAYNNLTQSYYYNQVDQDYLNQQSHSPLTSTQQYINNDYYQLSNNLSPDYISWNFPNVTFDRSYLVKITYRHHSGHPLKISLFDQNNLYKFADTKLDNTGQWTDAWFIVPKMESAPFNFGLTIFINNPAFDRNFSKNDVKDIKIYPFPYDQLIQTQVPPSTQHSTRTELESSSNIFYYSIPVSSFTFPVSSYLVLPQSYSAGWLAFYFNGIKPVFLENHVMVNNWSNGWQLPSSFRFPVSRIYVLFWPQLLEFFGLILIPISFVFVLKSRRR